MPRSVTIGDARRRGATTVGELGNSEPLLALPDMAYPATSEVSRVVAANALVSVDGNRYSVPPALVGDDVKVRRRLGSDELVVVSAAGTVVATHRQLLVASGGSSGSRTTLGLLRMWCWRREPDYKPPRMAAQNLKICWYSSE